MVAQTGQWVPLDIIPGIDRNALSGDSANRYVDGDKVRFRAGKAEKIGGCVEELSEQGSLRGCPRRGLPWTSLDGRLFLAIGTSSQLAIRAAGAYTDITPIKALGVFALTNPLTTTSGSNLVTVNTASPHAAVIGDFVEFPSSVTYNGVTLSGTYEITDVPTASTFVIQAATNASSSGTGGGSVTVNFLLPTGFCDTQAGGAGWGVGKWSEGTWGTPRPVGIETEARTWCLQNWGEDLLALPLGGALYYWDTSVGISSRATLVSQAPKRNNYMIVSSKFRQVILLGTEDVLGNYDPLLIRWSDSEDYTEWTPAVGNNAGEFRLARGTKIVSAVESLNGEIIVFTDSAVYKMQPTNTEDVYDVRIIADNVGALAPHAAIDVDGVVYFCSTSGWFTYSGVVRPILSSLDRFYFGGDGTYNERQKVKIHMGYNPDFNEVITFIPSGSSNEINRYVIFNIKEGIWYDGTWERLWWATGGVLRKPYAMDKARSLFIHEEGKNDNNLPMLSFIATGDFDIEEANRTYHIDGFAYDGEIVNNCTVQFSAKKWLNTTEGYSKTYAYLPTNPFISVRIKGRYVKFRWDSFTFNGDWRFGDLKVHIIPDSLR